MDSSTQAVAAANIKDVGIGGILALAALIGFALYFSSEEKKS